MEKIINLNIEKLLEAQEDNALTESLSVFSDHFDYPLVIGI